MPRIAFVVLAAFSLHLGAATARAGLISLSVVGGLTTLDSAAVITEPIPQESLSGSTLTQLGSPLLVDPAGALGLTVRIQNVSDQEIAFPDVLPGVSVLTGVSGVSGYTSKLNVAAGGASGKSGAAGTEGAVSRTVIDLADSLYAFSSPASGSNGGGGGAATGVADNWISLTGASGAELAAYLAGIRLAPGSWIDIPDFARIVAFQRMDERARIALGFDLPTFTFGGLTVTCGAWTGSFAGPGTASPPAPEPVALPEPPGATILPAGLAAIALCGRRRLAREEGRE